MNSSAPTPKKLPQNTTSQRRQARRALVGRLRADQNLK